MMTQTFALGVAGEVGCVFLSSRMFWGERLFGARCVKLMSAVFFVKKKQSGHVLKQRQCWWEGDVAIKTCNRSSNLPEQG